MLLVEVLRLLLALCAFAAAAQLTVVAWADRGTDRLLAQGALLVSLTLIAVDSLVRVGTAAPFDPLLFVPRVLIVGLSGWYAVRRLRVGPQR